MRALHPRNPRDRTMADYKPPVSVNAIPAGLGELWTDEQLCDFLQVDARTTARWRQTGGGPPYLRLGPGRGIIRYQPPKVTAWLADRTFDDRAAEETRRSDTTLIAA
jgi:hypothetical protein